MKEDYDESVEKGTLWNFDDAEAQLLFYLKSEFMSKLIEWNMEESYWKLKALEMEADALMEDDERPIVEAMIGQITNHRTEFNQDPDNLENKSQYFLLMEACYKQICLYIKAHGLYFREKIDFGDGL